MGNISKCFPFMCSYCVYPRGDLNNFKQCALKYYNTTILSK